MDGAHHKYQENLKDKLVKNLKFTKKIKLINCVGGGSSAYGLGEFIDTNKKQIELIGVEAGGPKL